MSAQIECFTIDDALTEWVIASITVDELSYRAYIRTKTASPNLMRSTLEYAFGKESVEAFEQRREREGTRL